MEEKLNRHQSGYWLPRPTARDDFAIFFGFFSALWPQQYFALKLAGHG